MINKIILALASVWLTCCVVTGELVFPLQDDTPDGMVDDFVKLEQWLEQRFRKETYPADALKAIVNETAQSSGSLDADLRNAMHIIVELSNQKQSGCDDRTLELARIAVQESGAIYVEKPLRLVAHLLQHFGDSAVRRCKTHISDKFRQLLAEWEQTKQVDIANMNSYELISPINMDEKDMARLVLMAGKRDPKRDDPEYLFDKYFKDPCKQHNDIFDQFYDSYFAVLDLERAPTGDSSADLMHNFDMELDYDRYLLCKTILTMDADTTVAILARARNPTSPDISEIEFES